MTYRNIKFIGDLHCNDTYKSIMAPGSINLGDLCVIKYKDRFTFDKTFQDRYGIGKRYFIDGNHDYFPDLKPDLMKLQEVAEGLIYIPRGYVSKRTLFIGGGESIDRDIRTPGVDWWPEENMSPRQFENIMNINEDIEVIVSHECPERVIYRVKHYINTSCSHFRVGLDNIFEKFHPFLWIFGHHHKTFDMTIDHCRFICVNIAQSVQFKIPIGHNIIA